MCQDDAGLPIDSSCLVGPWPSCVWFWGVRNGVGFGERGHTSVSGRVDEILTAATIRSRVARHGESVVLWLIILVFPGFSRERIAISGGPFLMGCDRSECADNTAPVHTVELSAFWINAFEVTQAEWEPCVAAGACQRPMGVYDPVTLADWPVVGITRADAINFCDREYGRLPTEAEWERAAAGTAGRVYPWGDSPPDCSRAQLPACGAAIGPVGAHPKGASPEGVHDLVGNAWEWVSDFYEAFYYRTSPALNPQGGTSQRLATVRGPSTWTIAHTQVTFRLGVPVPTRGVSLGFRCAGN